ncbi:MAG: DUF2339 domain-containing protein [Planctomycetes bacterium]|nr:DUF2339 domain-containing protein [Planctomycetota bacterium]
MKRLLALEQRFDAFEKSNVKKTPETPATQTSHPPPRAPVRPAPMESAASPISPPPIPSPPVVPRAFPSPPGTSRSKIEQRPARAASSNSIDAAERFIGGKLIGWLGGLALLLGTAFFLKLAFDRGWIKPELRVAMGALAGIGIFIMADVLFRRGQKVFASTAAGTGVALLILTNWAAFQLYQISGFGLAFALGCAITALGFGWSAWRKLLPTLILSEIGGFLVPVLIHQPSTSPWGITIYLGMLTAASAATGALRRWRPPSCVAVAGTILIMSAWIANSETLIRTANLYHATAWAVSFTILIMTADFGARAILGGAAAKWEAFFLCVASGWGMLALELIFQNSRDDVLHGHLALGIGAAMASIAYFAMPASAAVRAAAFIFAIITITRALPVYFEDAPLGVAYATWAGILAFLEGRTRKWIALVGSLFVHGLVGVSILSFGVAHENAQFLWSERTTVCAIEVVSLFITYRVFSTADDSRAAVGRIVFAAMQSLTAFILWTTVPASRVTAAWCAQAVAMAILFTKSKKADCGVLAVGLLLIAGLRFLEHRAFEIDADDWPFINIRSLTLALASAGLLITGLAARRFTREVNIRILDAGLLFLGIGVCGVWLAHETSFFPSRTYGADPGFWHFDAGTGEGAYRPFWNGRFVFLIFLLMPFALSTRLRIFGGGKDADSSEKTLAAFHTIIAHLLFLGAMSLEAMGLANPDVGARPLANLEATRASNVQGALSITLAVIPALALAIGFRRGRIHRYFGLCGFLVTAAKVLLVDLQHIALEWRMLVMLGLGALFLGGAWLYGRSRKSEAPLEQ